MSPLPVDYEMSTDAARSIAAAYARDVTGETGTAVVQQVMADFEVRHVIVSLGVLTGVLVRVLGDSMPGGPEQVLSLLGTIQHTTPEETP